MATETVGDTRGRQATGAGRDAEPGAAARPSALSPSRASDFLSCPLRYRFRVIDRLPEPPTVETARGTVVHAVLERLFDLPAVGRTPGAATELLQPAWTSLVAAEPEVAELVAGDDESPGAERLAGFLDAAAGLLDRYFTLEDPTVLEPAEREAHVECELASGLRLHGYIDRVDVAADGAVRIVDYKTGKAPREGFEQRALFQMRFYALVLWRLRGVVPRLLQLVYLGSGEVLRYAPDEADLLSTERKLEAVWAAIERARERGDWRASPGPLCDWCDHKVRCPAWGGTPPPLPPIDRASSGSGDGTDRDLEELPSVHASAVDL